MLEDEPWMRMSVSANLAKEYAADQVAFFRMLAGIFERNLPGTELKHRGIFGGKTVESIKLTLGGDRYELTEKKGRFEATETHVVRGIVLKTEPIAVEEWLQEVEAGLQALAAKDMDAQRALKAMMGLD